MSNGKHGLHTSLVAYIQSAVPFTCKMNKIMLAAEAELQAADTDRSKMRSRSKMSSITVLQSSLPFSSQSLVRMRSGIFFTDNCSATCEPI